MEARSYRRSDLSNEYSSWRVPLTATLLHVKVAVQPEPYSVLSYNDYLLRNINMNGGLAVARSQEINDRLWLNHMGSISRPDRAFRCSVHLEVCPATIMQDY